MEYVLLWCELYSKTLRSHGFMVNQYYSCIANSTIYGRQCMIAWYFDYNNISNIDEELNTKLIDTIAKHFGKIKVSGGKKHKFLGMDI